MTGEPHLARVLSAAAARYAGAGIVAREFARGKLRGDPIYRALLTTLPASIDTLVDIGCGQGLALALLTEAGLAMRRGDWPVSTPPPQTVQHIGIESRSRVAAIAQQALAEAAEIICARAPAGLPPSVSAALLLDVLHLMDFEQQQRLLQELRARMTTGGVVLVREADAGAGRGFWAVRAGNRVKNLLLGDPCQKFAFRSGAEWQKVLSGWGWSVEVWPMSEGTPFANVLFRLVKR